MENRKPEWSLIKEKNFLYRPYKPYAIKHNVCTTAYSNVCTTAYSTGSYCCWCLKDIPNIMVFQRDLLNLNAD